MKTAIILPSYLIDEENLEIYNTFIRSLRAHTPRDQYVLFILDNGSKLGVDQMMSDADVFFTCPLPVGYAKAVNIGVEIVRELQGFMGLSDQFIVINNDIEVEEAWLSRMTSIQSETGGLLAPQDTRQHTDRLYHNESWYSLWCTDLKVWADVGRLDDQKLNFRFHDQDYSIRLFKKKYFIGRTGFVQVKHANSATYKKMGRNEDPAEREEMISRHGHALFTDYCKAHS